MTPLAWRCWSYCVVVCSSVLVEASVTRIFGGSVGLAGCSGLCTGVGNGKRMRVEPGSGMRVI